MPALCSLPPFDPAYDPSLQCLRHHIQSGALSSLKCLWTKHPCRHSQTRVSSSTSAELTLKVNRPRPEVDFFRNHHQKDCTANCNHCYAAGFFFSWPGQRLTRVLCFISDYVRDNRNVLHENRGLQHSDQSLLPVLGSSFFRGVPWLALQC